MAKSAVCVQALLPGALLAKFTADQLASGLAAFRDQARRVPAYLQDCPFVHCVCGCSCRVGPGPLVSTLKKKHKAYMLPVALQLATMNKYLPRFRSLLCAHRHWNRC